MELNIGNSVFQGLNDKKGLMICGYEWGYSKEDQKLDESDEECFYNKDAITTFSNKSPMYGDKAFSWRYDNRIIKWFDMWGHPLNRDELGGDFEKSIIQTNWCDTQAYKINLNYYHKLTNSRQVDNFIHHIKIFEPSLILFMGSEIIDILQDKNVLNDFCKIMGNTKGKPHKIQKPFEGRSFKIGFQEFDRCKIVSMPHPSSSRGLSDGYMSLFSDEISRLITELKKNNGV
jgi:hypothetical protein